MRLSFSMASLVIALFVLVDVAAVARVIQVKVHDPRYPASTYYDRYYIYRAPTAVELVVRMVWAGPLALVVTFSLLALYKRIPEDFDRERKRREQRRKRFEPVVHEGLVRELSRQAVRPVETLQDAKQ